MSILEKMRSDKLLKPEGTHIPCEGEWRDDPKPSDWKKSPAVASKNAMKTHQPKPRTAAQLCQCNQPVYKSGRCHQHYKEYEREKARAYRARRRLKKTAKVRVCNVCGEAAYEKATINLCPAHYNEYVKRNNKRHDAETDAIKEESMERRRVLLETLWNKKQTEQE